MTISRPPFIFLNYDSVLGKLHDRFPSGDQKLQRNGRASIIWVVLDFPRLPVHADADQLHCVLVDHPLIIRRKDEIVGFLF